DAVLGHVLRERHAVGSGLADGLVVQDRAGDVLGQPRRGQQQLAVGAAVFLGVVDAHRGEALADGGGGLVDGDDALAGRDQRLRGLGELLDAHWGTSLAGEAGPGSIAAGTSAPGASASARRKRNGRPEAPVHSRVRDWPQRSPRPLARPSEPTSSRRRVLVAPWVSMCSPEVNTTRSPGDSMPASTSTRMLPRAASRGVRPRLSKLIGNTSRISAMRRRAPSWRVIA